MGMRCSSGEQLGIASVNLGIGLAYRFTVVINIDPITLSRGTTAAVAWNTLHSRKIFFR